MVLIKRVPRRGCKEAFFIPGTLFGGDAHFDFAGGAVADDEPAMREDGDFVVGDIKHVGFVAELDGVGFGEETDGADALGVGVFGEAEDFLVGGFVEGGGNSAGES